MSVCDVELSGDMQWSDEAVEQVAALFLDLADQASADEAVDAPIVPIRQRSTAGRDTSNTTYTIYHGGNQ